MKEKPTWAIILAGCVLIILGYYLKGFFIINYVIGSAAILIGIYNVYKEKK